MRSSRAAFTHAPFRGSRHGSCTPPSAAGLDRPAAPLPAKLVRPGRGCWAATPEAPQFQPDSERLGQVGPIAQNALMALLLSKIGKYRKTRQYRCCPDSRSASAVLPTLCGE
jgi:hypothetical protein